MTNKIWHYAGITGLHIDAVQGALTARLWDFVGIDYDGGRAVYGFEMGDTTTLHVYTDANGICGKVVEEIV